MSSAPQSLGQYQIIREIARSNDIVYEAYDPLMNRRVAVKELSMPAGSTPQQLEDRISRFRREAQAVGSLNHPNIMTVFSFSQEGSRYFMAMEFLDGITLRKEIDNKGFLTAEASVDLISGVLNGLAHAHDAGVVHRDIKPDNIQLTSENGVKITDFGIARLTFQPNLTMDGQVFGTPSYMSPEQVVGKEIDARTDLFSVGVMLYEMLTGVKPFLGDNVIAITHAIINSKPAKHPTIPDPLWQVIERALEKAPQMRFHNAREMLAALRSALDEVQRPLAAPPPMLTNHVTQGGGPYGAPIGAPPVIDPYANPYGGPSMTPYGGVVPTGPALPYTQPYGQPPPPVNYGAYNPYQAPMPGQPPPLPPGYFYPPPPRQPLISPDTSSKIRTFIWIFLMAALIIAILVYGVNALLSSAGQVGKAEPERTRFAPGTRPAPEALDPELRPPADPGLDPGQLDVASAAAEGMRNKADAVFASARQASDPFRQMELLEQAGDLYAVAGEIAKDNAAQCYNEAYKLAEETGASNTVRRRILRKLVDLFFDGPEGEQFRRQLDQLNGL